MPSNGGSKLTLRFTQDLHWVCVEVYLAPDVASSELRCYDPLMRTVSRSKLRLMQRQYRHVFCA